ncbi:malto-oligosyltrehalose trehalohydrolase [Rhodobacteraceae bacterium HSP-20]|uniref:Malto-oligosyltrehalose trehalohydrolase n=1 Tax=Paragemmobacter amnigenus TaxID=2852097 RepID=A0ABS6J345_9RHOB|nr:malto-oligosyltrehalose trehalohydrolase [Rhodobacter amnigenus]MBU9698179.1 malto-oligosyltrehalose trehalohydrolase [Rhodobacter amnigenus]MBV4389406.1 malto-oligosyltrehalose trehalohydrolase [Rhodobacter amnigenus]
MHLPSRQTLPFLRDWGADPVGRGVWRFSIWAPQADSVAVTVEDRHTPLRRYGDGMWRAEAPAQAGETYLFHIDGHTIPDPAARAQAGDVHAPSRLIDPTAYRWTTRWSGRPWEETVLHELHIGTFTAQGTFRAAEAELPRLAALGFTAIELMPVAQFAGHHGWGYDGVLPYAPHPAYGTPDDLKHLVETAQSLGLMVFLDVVYNHFGPDGFHLARIAPVFHPDSHTPWGKAIDFTRAPLRRFLMQNALYWLAEYRLDGLRLDAIDGIDDPSDPDFVTELALTIRNHGFDRPIHLMTEDDRNITRYNDPAAGLNIAEWNDDWHHAVHCLLSGESHDYYASFARDPLTDLRLSLTEGFVEQGQPRPPKPGPRGEPSAHLPPTAFVNFNQNHDQIGNRPKGERLLTLTDPARARVAHALLLATPPIPLLFMGEEMGTRTPFRFFSDHGPALAASIRDGRAQEFPHLHRDDLPDPNDPAHFHASRPQRPDDAAEWEALTAALLHLRATRIVPLVKSGTPQATATITAPATLAAGWRFPAGTLRLTARFAPDPDATPPKDTPALALGDPTTGPSFALWLA